ncbi:SCO-spondin-like [Sycon ciliatum]|uniref:SCO-spondin-like n=1 Tax=Sycon ciliatum TaxID=27933 RepID=UPI0031F6A58D
MQRGSCCVRGGGGGVSCGNIHAFPDTLSLTSLKLARLLISTFLVLAFVQATHGTYVTGRSCSSQYFPNVSIPPGTLYHPLTAERNIDYCTQCYCNPRTGVADCGQLFSCTSCGLGWKKTCPLCPVSVLCCPLCQVDPAHAWLASGGSDEGSSTSSIRKGCTHDGSQYLDGEEWHDATRPCYRCNCTNGVEMCFRKPCSNTKCAAHLTPMDVYPFSCCPVCTDLGPRYNRPNPPATLPGAANQRPTTRSTPPPMPTTAAAAQRRTNQACSSPKTAIRCRSWSSWSPCSRECNGPNQQRMRTRYCRCKNKCRCPDEWITSHALQSQPCSASDCLRTCDLSKLTYKVYELHHTQQQQQESGIRLTQIVVFLNDSCKGEYYTYGARGLSMHPTTCRDFERLKRSNSVTTFKLLGRTRAGRFRKLSKIRRRILPFSCTERCHVAMNALKEELRIQKCIQDQAELANET